MLSPLAVTPLLNTLNTVPATEQTILWITCVLMALGALAIVLAGRSAPEERHHLVLSFFVPVIAACAYFAMATGQGDLQVDDRRVYFARYLDWVLTTPLLLLGLLIVGLPLMRRNMEDSRSRNGLIGAVVGADVGMIVAGLFASLSTDSMARWVWYVISCGFFLAVLWSIWVPVRQSAATLGPANAALYGRLLMVLTVLWLIYPVLWVLGTEGLGIISSTVEVLVFAIIDVCAKVGFGLIVVIGVKAHPIRAEAAPRGQGVAGAAAAT